MEDARQHDQHQARFDVWVRDHGKAVRGFLWAMTGSHDDADELYQEVFARAWQNRHRYQERGYPRAYLLQIANRLLIDRARQRPSRTASSEYWKAFEPSDNGESPDARLARQEAAHSLEQAMNQLSEIQRQVLLLHYYGEMTYAEVAQVVDMPLNTVLSHARRGIRQLQRIL